MIAFENLGRRYGDIVAVHDLTLNVPPGEVYAMLGANGAGKTTALRCLATLLKPSSGRTTVAGYDSSTHPLEVRRRLGFLAASAGLYERLSPRELLSYLGALQSVAPATIARRVPELIELFDLTSFADRLCGTLSTGQRQRVSIARSIVHDPPAIVLDEPTLGLDVLSGEAIQRFVLDSRERGCAVLFSTHQMSEVELLADRVGIIAGGRLAAEGTIQRILEQTSETTLSHAFLKIVKAGR